jgi:hypothetical protein
MVKYQHNKNIKVTIESYEYVYGYKKELLKNIMKLFNDLDIKIFICYGNLIEYERNSPIYHDDDIDMIFDVQSFPKWIQFCNENNRNLEKYNLKFDDRWKYEKKQKNNGIEARLIDYKCPDNLKEFKTMDINTDLIASQVDKKNIWPDWNPDFNNLRPIILWNVKTYAPSKNDTKKILTKHYNKNYLIPNLDYKVYSKDIDDNFSKKSVEKFTNTFQYYKII